MNAFERYYQDVPPEQRERLAKFRETHPLKQARVRETSWEYIACGQGEATILWLVGGLRVADAAYRSIPLLEDAFRILAPTYPAIHRMSDLTDGLIGLLDAEGVDKAHVLAGSFGGMVAQALARRYPERIERVILSTTAVLDAEALERYRQQEALVIAAEPEVIAQVSQPRFLEMIAPPDEERAFWTAYVKELFSERLTKDDLLSTLHCLLDFAENTPLSAEDLADWGKRILIIESEDDATFDANARARLKALYPNAVVHSFQGGGHSPATTRRAEFFHIVRRFLRAMG